jgi:hypothetical protein
MLDVEKKKKLPVGQLYFLAVLFILLYVVCIGFVCPYLISYPSDMTVMIGYAILFLGFFPAVYMVGKIIYRKVKEYVE